MACPAIITGDNFLERVLTHIDCQAQVIGSYGYLALGQPGSLAATFVTGLLTLFIAFFGIRLLLGPPPGARDVVYNVLKIGIVLTLAFSWPAFRTVVYDVTLKGPAEIASVIQTGSGIGDAGDFTARLQQADNAMVRLTEFGTGRNTGRFIQGQGPGSNFAGTALQDDEALGSARLLYLASIIGTLALLRIAAGVLLALAPIVAGLYFFNQSRGIFAGWLKGLVLTVAGSIGATMILSVQLAIVEPWLADALQIRAAGYATPAAPIELFAIMLAFAIVQVVMIWLLAKVVFNRGWVTMPAIPIIPELRDRIAGPAASQTLSANQPQTLRAQRISTTIENAIRREQEYSSKRFTRTIDERTLAPQTASRDFDNSRLGNSYRRSSSRAARAMQIRDRSK